MLTDFKLGIKTLYIVLLLLPVLTVAEPSGAQENHQPANNITEETSPAQGIQTQAKGQVKQPQSNALSTEKKSFSFLSKQTKAGMEKQEPDTTMDALNVSLGLIFILLVIFSLAWFMRKMGYSNISGQGHLKILASLNLGQKEKIALIQVGKQQLLVGITVSQINTLYVLDESLDTIATQSGAGNRHFAHKLTEILKADQSKKTPER